MGSLNEEQMCQRYLRSNVFVCPSAIENSPNSLGEAQLLGVPCIASYVGGSMDMMEGCEKNLYRFEEVEVLAQKVCRVFSERREANVELQNKVRNRHDGKINSIKLLSIYNKLTK
jgi:glycosyltransferase involved in cell wall biosynthesis